MIVSIAAAALAWRLEALLHPSRLKPCNTVYPSIRRHAAMAGI
jgi:hypothetical protein